jgi:predicted TPR repeat methyltransferase
MSSSATTLLQAAIAAHRAGRLEEAEDGYRQVLQRVPEEPMALYLLGLLCFHRGDTDSATRHITRSLARAPDNVPAWKDLGGILMAGDRLEEAREAYAEAVKHGPQLGQSWYNLGICLSKLGDAPGAIAHLQQALTREPEFVRSYEPLATLLYRSGDLPGAAEVYRLWLQREPDNPTARHMAAAAAGSDVARASDDYIRAHFDEAAGSFDTNLAQLRYRAPQRVADTLIRLCAAAPVATLLDAGCGTGLCGPLVKPCCQRLIGVDLSPAMLTRAASRGCYDELVEAELTGFLCSRQAAFDAVICVDTLVYFGALEPPLAAVHGALRPQGLFIFTLEAGSGAAARLEIHGRYTHGEAHVRQALSRAGLELLALTPETLREERQQPVAGLLVSARRV